LICWFVRPRLPCATRRVSFRPACIAVSIDSGSGIDLQVLDRIFDPMFTTKPEGMGLGLSGVAQSSRRQYFSI
jgi:signal transduction histidine kinase